MGTRSSLLAKTQSQWVATQLVGAGLEVELVELESPGDTDRSTPLYEIELETPGIFTKHLETKLLEGQIDLAVHSLKDLPTTQPQGLKVSAISKRARAGDCLFVRKDRFSKDLVFGIPNGGKVGTSSLRREALVLSVRPDAKVQPVRGNVPTRLKKVMDRELDAVVLAQAGIERLALSIAGLTQIDLPEDVFVSAPGQGALGVETRSDASEELIRALAQIHDAATAAEVSTERRVLQALEGGCTLPLGVRCSLAPSEKKMKLRAFLGILDSRSTDRRRWGSFQYFESEDENFEELGNKAVRFFKEVMHAGN